MCYDNYSFPACHGTLPRLYLPQDSVIEMAAKPPSVNLRSLVCYLPPLACAASMHPMVLLLPAAPYFNTCRLARTTVFACAEYHENTLPCVSVKRPEAAPLCALTVHTRRAQACHAVHLLVQDSRASSRAVYARWRWREIASVSLGYEGVPHAEVPV